MEVLRNDLKSCSHCHIGESYFVCLFNLLLVKTDRDNGAVCNIILLSLVQATNKIIQV